VSRLSLRFGMESTKTFWSYTECQYFMFLFSVPHSHTPKVAFRAFRTSRRLEENSDAGSATTVFSFNCTHLVPHGSSRWDREVWLMLIENWLRKVHVRMLSRAAMITIRTGGRVG
jgi:hypothetical protein